MIVKLSKRLQLIDSMVAREYDHVWDCCCDHGLLGHSLIARKASGHIHFVDIVPQLMTALRSTLEDSYKDKESQWTVHCCDVQNVPLNTYLGCHLVIIAGVGGDLVNDIVTSLNHQYPDVNIEYLLCPVYHQFSVRKKLIDLGFGVKEESLILENKRYYEVMLVGKKLTNSDIKEISPVGEDIWDFTDERGREIAQGYLEKVKDHYRKRQCSGDLLDKEALQMYTEIVV